MFSVHTFKKPKASVFKFKHLDERFQSFVSRLTWMIRLFEKTWLRFWPCSQKFHDRIGNERQQSLVVNHDIWYTESRNFSSRIHLHCPWKDVHYFSNANLNLFLFFYSMASYTFENDAVLDRNQNITRQPAKISRVNVSDDEGDREISSGFRGRSQSLKYLNEREETETISRSKSLRDVDTGDFDNVKARVSYVDSWNPVNPVGRGRIAKKIQSWENLDVDGDNMSRDTENGYDRKSYNSSNSSRKQSYEGYARYGSAASGGWRDERYEQYEGYSQETSASYLYSDRDLDDQVGESDNSICALSLKGKFRVCLACRSVNIGIIKRIKGMIILHIWPDSLKGFHDNWKRECRITVKVIRFWLTQKLDRH